jgi:Nitronate monooxygenase
MAPISSSLRAMTPGGIGGCSSPPISRGGRLTAGHDGFGAAGGRCGACAGRRSGRHRRRAGIAAAFALGAAGVQLGTPYLLCPEAGTSPLHRKALEGAGADSTVMTSAFTSRPARALVNRFTREIAPFAVDAPAFPDALSAVLPLRMEAERRGSIDFTPLCGRGRRRRSPRRREARN